MPHSPEVNLSLLLGGDRTAFLVGPDVEAMNLTGRPLGRPAEIHLHDLADGEVVQVPSRPSFQTRVEASTV
ncbi:hypothetical protein EBU58_16365 [bacterium]|nr:hypothetical protein [bacterium]